MSCQTYAENFMKIHSYFFFAMLLTQCGRTEIHTHRRRTGWLYARLSVSNITGKGTKDWKLWNYISNIVMSSQVIRLFILNPCLPKYPTGIHLHLKQDKNQFCVSYLPKQIKLNGIYIIKKRYEWACLCLVGHFVHYLWSISWIIQSGNLDTIIKD